MTTPPPDPNASVGTSQIVQLVNVAFAVYSKTGATIMGPTNTNTLWAGFGGSCENTNDGDAVVRWDTLAKRWIITQFAATPTTGPFYQCVAVSEDSDATGRYHRYAFNYQNFNDYPKLSVWPDAYYITYNMFRDAGAASPFLNGKVCALDRARMLTGAAASQQCFDTSPNHGGLLAADLDGSTPPPAGEPGLVLGQNTNTTLAYWKFHVDWAAPANSTFTGPTPLAVAPYTVVCVNTRDCVPQGGTTQRLDAVSQVMMYRLAYRNFGDHESLVVNHTVQADASAGVRWYELRLSGGNPTVYQQGTYAPDTTWRWMGSAAQDHVGNMAVGYSQSSDTSFPSIRFTGRLADAPLGTLPLGETVIQNGLGSQTTENRWGDYTSMAIDPSDDCTFWYTNQYQPATGVNNWHTRLASFKLPNCPPAPKPSLTTAKRHNGKFTQGGTGTYTITVGNSGPGATDGTTVTVKDTLPAGLTARSLSGPGWTCTPATLTCTRSDALAAGSTYPPITLKARIACRTQRKVTNTATVTGGGDTATHTATHTTTIRRSHNHGHHHGKDQCRKNRKW